MKRVFWRQLKRCAQTLRHKSPLARATRFLHPFDAYHKKLFTNMEPKVIRTSIPVLLLVAFAAGCATEPEAPFTPITEEAEFKTRVVGKTLDYGNGEIAVQTDGTMSGTFGADAVSGTWEWKDGKFCRTAQIGARGYPYTCQTAMIRGDEIRFVDPDGTYRQTPTIR